MDQYMDRVRCSVAIDSACRCLSNAITYAGSAYLFDHERQLSEALFECVQIRREIVELPRQTGVPPALEDFPDSADEGLPF